MRKQRCEKGDREKSVEKALTSGSPLGQLGAYSYWGCSERLGRVYLKVVPPRDEEGSWGIYS